MVLLQLSSRVQADTPPVLDFSTIVHEQAYTPDCAITFDDGPGPHTGALLDVLTNQQVKATFFTLGEHVRRYPDLIRRMVAEGHEVENHSWDHPDMRKLDEASREREISDTVAILKSLGATPHFFRPPYGAYDTALVETAHKDGLQVVLWTHDSVDWRYHTVAQLEQDILPPGSGAHGVFLFHDIQDGTIAAMPAILGSLRAKGCRFVTVEQWVADTEQARLLAGAKGPSQPVQPAAGGTAPPAKSGFRGWLKTVW